MRNVSIHKSYNPKNKKKDVWKIMFEDTDYDGEYDRKLVTYVPIRSMRGFDNAMNFAIVIAKHEKMELKVRNPWDKITHHLDYREKKCNQNS